MVKAEFPPLEAQCSDMKYIGVYLSSMLEEVGIRTIEDLVIFLYLSGDETEPLGEMYDKAVRDWVKVWLKEIVSNARARQCIPSNTLEIGDEERMYEVRDCNFKGYNAIIGLWLHYVEGRERRWIPHRLRGYGVNRKYPRRCVIR